MPLAQHEHWGPIADCFVPHPVLSCHCPVTTREKNLEKALKEAKVKARRCVGVGEGGSVIRVAPT